jgi:lipoprotein-anchoring transpeptidase ErfK/SrfK
MSRHRLERTRPRYGRIVAAGSSVVVTAVAVLGALGAVPTSSTGANAGDQQSSAANTRITTDDSNRSAERTGERSLIVPGEGDQSDGETADLPGDETAADSVATALPAGSGKGRRVVFSESAQRVWLVASGNEVARTYLVSGSAYDNLDPGTYSVFSRSERAWGIDESGSMRWFVRFAEGPNAAIGFHSIPLLNGSPVQTIAQLGIPLSHGCIRQKTADARALWEFAPVGTTVVVTA